MKNEIVTRKVIERGKDWLRIGNFLFTIKYKVDIDDQKKYQNIIYLENLDSSIESENIEDAIEDEELSEEFSKYIDITYEELFNQLLENDIVNFIPFNTVREIREIKNALEFSCSPYLGIDYLKKTEQEISYLISCNIDNWNLGCTMTEFIEELKDAFMSSYNSHIGVALLEKDSFSGVSSLSLRLDYSKIKEYSIFELENNIKKVLISTSLKIKNGGEELKLPIHDPDLKFILKQYMIGFPEYLRNLTGQIIQFEIESVSDGLVFTIGKYDNQDEIQKELTKYMKFLKDENLNFEELNELNLNPVQIIGIRAFVRAQVMNFRHQLENLNDLLKFEKRSNEFLDKTNKRLSETIKMVRELFEKHIESNKINTVNISANNQLENKNNIEIDIQFNENIEKLQESVFEMKNLLNPLINDLLKKELQEIDNDLMEINNSQEFNKNKGIIGKLKRFVNGIKNISGTVILAGQAINASGETIQSLFKLKDIILNMISELGK